MCYILDNTSFSQGGTHVGPRTYLVDPESGWGAELLRRLGLPRDTARFLQLLRAASKSFARAILAEEDAAGGFAKIGNEDRDAVLARARARTAEEIADLATSPEIAEKAAAAGQRRVLEAIRDADSDTSARDAVKLLAGADPIDAGTAGFASLRQARVREGEDRDA